MEPTTPVNIRIPKALKRRILHLKADEKIDSITEFFISAAEDKATTLEKEEEK